MKKLHPSLSKYFKGESPKSKVRLPESNFAAIASLLNKTAPLEELIRMRIEEEAESLNMLLTVQLSCASPKLMRAELNSGILATGARPDARFNYAPAPPEIMERVSRIERVCAAHGVPLAVAALQFALAGPAVASVILGGVTPEEVERNAAALLHPVPQGLWSDLKSEGFLTSTVPTPI